MQPEPLSSIPSPVNPARDARQNLRWLFVVQKLSLHRQLIKEINYLSMVG